MYTRRRSFALGSDGIEDLSDIFLRFHQITFYLFDFLKLGCVLVLFLEDILLKLEELLAETLFHSTLILFERIKADTYLVKLLTFTGCFCLDITSRIEIHRVRRCVLFPVGYVVPIYFQLSG